MASDSGTSPSSMPKLVNSVPITHTNNILYKFFSHSFFEFDRSNLSSVFVNLRKFSSARLYSLFIKSWISCPLHESHELTPPKPSPLNTPHIPSSTEHSPPVVQQRSLQERTTFNKPKYIKEKLESFGGFG